MTGSNSFWFANPSTGFYNDVITSSCRFNGSTSKLVSPSFGSDLGNTWTWSAWVKFTNQTSDRRGSLFNPVGESASFYFESNDFLSVNDDGAVVRNTSRLLRDSSSWYHIVLNGNGTLNKLWINGVLATFGTDPNLDDFNKAVAHQIGGSSFGTNYFFDGIMADINFVSETALDYTAFAETKNGVLIPKEPSVTYGANGFRLQFKQTGSGADASGIGADTSGNDQHFTATGLDAYDILPDSPENNFCTLNPLDKSFNSSALSEGNLSVSAGTGSAWNNIVNSTFTLTSGKWYWEVYQNGSGGFGKIGVRQNNSLTSADSHSAGASEVYLYDGNKHQGSTSTDSSYYGSAMYADGNVFGIALDMDAGKIWVAKANAYGGSADPTTGNGAMFTNLTEPQSPSFSSYNMAAIFNFGQDDTFSGEKTSGSANANDANGNGEFYYAPPSGFLALCSANLDDSAIGPNSATQSDDHFKSSFYAGNDNATRTFDLGFVSDWAWFKAEADSIGHQLYDSSRGVTKYLSSNTTDNEQTNSEGVTDFDDNGSLKIGNSNFLNKSSRNFSLWNWKANGGTTSTIAVDSVSTGVPSIASTVQANTDAGFSIVTYTGTGSAGTIGHGLGKKPDHIIFKSRTENGTSWANYLSVLGAGKYLALQATQAVNSGTDSGRFNNTEPTTNVFSVGTHVSVNTSSSHTYVAYCFAEVEGFSKFGIYTANESTDGVFIYLGFRPAWAMIKRTAGNAWAIQDSARSPINPVSNLFQANESNTVYTTGVAMDFLSNGIKMRNDSGFFNHVSGDTFIYLAFAEAPFKYANAR